MRFRASSRSFGTGIKFTCRKYKGIYLHQDISYHGQELLHLSLNDSMQHYMLGEECLESCMAEKNLGVLADSQLNISQQCAQVTKRREMRNIMASWTKQGIVPLYSPLVRLHLKYCAHFQVHHYKKGNELLKHVQRRATKLVKEQKIKHMKEQLRELRLLSLQKRPSGDLYNYVKGGFSKKGIGHFSQMTSDRTHTHKKKKPNSSCSRKGLDYI